MARELAGALRAQEADPFGGGGGPPQEQVPATSEPLQLPSGEKAIQQKAGTALALVTLEAREISSATLKDALEIGTKCFPREEDHRAMVEVYNRYISGSRQYFDKDLESQLNLLSYWVYYDRFSGQRAGIGGLFSEGDKDPTVWMAWIAVDPDYVAGICRLPKGVPTPTQQMLLHQQHTAREFGFTTLNAYTYDSPDNLLPQAMYERNGFTQTGTFELEGHRQRIYEIRLR